MSDYIAIYRTVVGTTALLLWLGSLAAPAITMCPSISWPGWHLLFLGWLGPLILQFGWFANPVMLWAIRRLLFLEPAGIMLSLLGLFLALSSFSWKGISGDSPAFICQHDYGFFAWIACAVLLSVASFVEWAITVWQLRTFD